MSIAYPDWSPEQEPAPPRSGIGAGLAARAVAEQKTLRERLPSIAISIFAHGAIAYVIIFAGLTAMKPKEEVQTISVSIAAPQTAQPEPPPPAPKMEVPDVAATVAQIAPPQLQIALPPSQMAIQAAPPQPPAPPQQQADKPAEEAPVSPPRFDAAYLNNPAPVYPNMSRRLREVGVVQLRVRVSATGAPLEVQLAKSSGYARLDESALAAVQKWKFQAANRNGAALEAWVLVPVEFSLTKG